MSNSKENSVGMFTALFKDPIAAEKAYNLALQKGYKKDEISVLMSEETKEKSYSNKLEGSATLPIKGATIHDAAEGAGAGGALGTAAGAIAGAVAAVGTSLVIPGLGLVIAGPVAAGLAGAGAGGIAGGVVGALLNIGLSENEAAKYERAVKDGGVIISIKPRSEEEAKSLAEEWKAYGCTDFSKLS